MSETTAETPHPAALPDSIKIGETVYRKADPDERMGVIVAFAEGENFAIQTSPSEALRLAQWFISDDGDEGMLLTHYDYNDRPRIFAVRREDIRCIS